MFEGLPAMMLLSIPLKIRDDELCEAFQSDIIRQNDPLLIAAVSNSHIRQCKSNSFPIEIDKAFHMVGARHCARHYSWLKF